MRISILLISIVSLGFACSCSHEETREYDELRRIEKGLEFDPKRSLAELDSLQEKGGARELAWQMKWNLLHTKAEDKAFIPHRTDSVMKRVVDYYAVNGSEQDLLEALYYMGSVCRDMGMLGKARAWYERASDYGTAHLSDVDANTICFINAQLADLYEKRNQFFEALNCMKQNYALRRERKDEYVSIYEIAHAYKNASACMPEKREYKDSADIFFAELFTMFSEGRIPNNEVGMLAEGLSFYSFFGEKEKSEQWHKAVGTHLTAEVPMNVYVAEGFYWRLIGAADSAKACWKYVIDNTESLSTKEFVAYYLYQYCRETGDEEGYARYAVLDDSLKEQLFVLNQKMFFDDQIEPLPEKEGGLGVAIFWLMIGIIAIALFAAVVILIRKQPKARKEALQDEVKTPDLNSSGSNAYARLQEAFLLWGNTGKVPEAEANLWTELESCIRAEHGEYFALVRKQLPKITEVNMRILLLHHLNLRNKQISTILSLSESTVSHRLRRIEEKLKHHSLE